MGTLPYIQTEITNTDETEVREKTHLTFRKSQHDEKIASKHHLGVESPILFFLTFLTFPLKFILLWLCLISCPYHSLSLISLKSDKGKDLQLLSEATMLLQEPCAFIRQCFFSRSVRTNKGPLCLLSAAAVRSQGFEGNNTYPKVGFVFQHISQLSCHNVWGQHVLQPLMFSSKNLLFLFRPLQGHRGCWGLSQLEMWATPWTVCQSASAIHAHGILLE